MWLPRLFQTFDAGSIQPITHPGTNIVHPCLTSKITYSQHEPMIHQVTRTDLGDGLLSVIKSRILVSIWIQIW